MSNLTKRVLTAIVLVAVLLICLFLAPPPAATLLFAFFLLMAVWEWSGFFAGTNVFVRVLYLVLTGGVGALMQASPEFGLYTVYIGVGFWLLALVVLHLLQRTQSPRTYPESRAIRSSKA